MQAQFIWPTFKKLGKCRIRGKKNLDVSFTNGTFGHSRPVFIQGGGAARVGMDGKQAGFENELCDFPFLTILNVNVYFACLTPQALRFLQFMKWMQRVFFFFNGQISLLRGGGPMTGFACK